MSLLFSLTLACVCLNVLGTIVLAFSLNSIIKSLENSILGLEATRDTMVNQDILVFEGMEVIRKKSNLKSKKLCILGIALILLANLFQLTIAILSN